VHAFLSADRRMGEASRMLLEDYGLIGDWLCMPRFDSGSCVAAILGDERHGRWLVGPAGEARASSRRYVPALVTLDILPIIGLAAAIRLPADTAQPAVGHR
jgi:Domain of unknown function (DUF5911)